MEIKKVGSDKVITLEAGAERLGTTTFAGISNGSCNIPENACYYGLSKKCRTT